LFRPPHFWRPFQSELSATGNQLGGQLHNRQPAVDAAVGGIGCDPTLYVAEIVARFKDRRCSTVRQPDPNRPPARC